MFIPGKQQQRKKFTAVSRLLINEKNTKFCGYYNTDPKKKKNSSLLPNNINIDKMIVFSMWSEDYRDSLYLNEFNKKIGLFILVIYSANSLEIK